MRCVNTNNQTPHSAIVNEYKPASPYKNLKRLSYIERNLKFRVPHGGPDSPFMYGLGELEIPLLAAFDDFAWLSIRTHMPPFYSVRSNRGVTAQPNSLWFRAAGKLAHHYSSIRRIAGGFDPATPAARQLAYAPHLALLMELFFKHSVRFCERRNDVVDDGSGRIAAEVYNDFVAEFRKAIMARNLLRRELHSWGLSSQENATNLHAYLHGLFAKHGNLTVVHLRLLHTRERSAVSLAPVEDQLRELNALRKARTVFFDRMRRKPALFTTDPAYVWSILPSLEGAYDLHLTLLFSTVALRKVHDDKRAEAEQFGTVQRDHADQVGEYWVERATGGRGHYLRGDANPLLYGPDWVHGEVSADDVGKREKLKETLGYLAMRRALVRLKGEPPGEYFGMREREARRPRRSVHSGEKAG